MKAGRYVSAVLLLLVALLAVWVAYKWAHPVSVGTLHLDLTEMPADDKPLQQWLSSQPNMMEVTVTRGNNILTVEYKMPGRDLRDYANNILQECKQLGYTYKSYSVHSEYNPLL